MTGIGRAHRKGFEIQVKMQGQMIFAHKNFGTIEGESFETRGLKDVNESNRRQVVFKFPEQEEIYPGMVLQTKGSRDYWKVTDTEDLIQDDTYICLEVWVEKINEQGTNMRLNAEGKAVFYGSVSGGVQVGGYNNTQTVNVTNVTQDSEFDKAIQGILEVIKTAPIPEEDKEELTNDVKALNNLAVKATPDAAERAKLRLQVLEISLKAADLAVKTAPYLPAIYAFFEGLTK